MTVNPKEYASHYRDVMLVGWVGVVCNLTLGGLKCVLGHVAGSRAVFADGVHSLSDLVTDIAVIVGVKYWTRPADDSHPHGHRRIETLVTAIIGIILAGVALGIGYRAFADLGKPVARPGWAAFTAAMVSIVGKEILFRWNMVVAKRAKSQALVANAWHHRSDSLSSIPAAAAVAVALIFPKLGVVDLVGAVIVSLFILHAAWSIFRPALDQLIDRAAPTELVNTIQELSLAVPGVKEVHAIRTRYLGSCIQADLHVLVDPTLSVRVGHDIAHAVRERLVTAEPEIVDVVVHIEPFEEETKPGQAGQE